MPKMTPYEKGRKHEYQAIQTLQNWFGCYCIRSAGSHTPVDIIAGNGVEVYAVQVKTTSTLGTVNWDELRQWAEAFQATPMVLEKAIGGKWKVYIDGERITVSDT